MRRQEVLLVPTASQPGLCFINIKEEIFDIKGLFFRAVRSGGLSENSKLSRSFQMFQRRFLSRSQACCRVSAERTSEEQNEGFWLVDLVMHPAAGLLDSENAPL